MSCSLFFSSVIDHEEAKERERKKEMTEFFRSFLFFSGTIKRVLCSFSIFMSQIERKYISSLRSWISEITSWKKKPIWSLQYTHTHTPYVSVYLPEVSFIRWSDNLTMLFVYIITKHISQTSSSADDQTMFHIESFRSSSFMMTKLSVRDVVNQFTRFRFENECDFLWFVLYDCCQLRCLVESNLAGIWSINRIVLINFHLSVFQNNAMHHWEWSQVWLLIVIWPAVQHMMSPVSALKWQGEERKKNSFSSLQIEVMKFDLTFILINIGFERN